MILPATYTAALLLTILSMICWGSWANTFKLTGKWRFELFYFDYSLGVLLAAILAAATFGSLGDDLSVMDNFLITGKRQIAYGFAGGVIFNLANMLLMAAISIAGLAVAFPIGIGLALVIGVIGNYLINPQGNPALLFAGAGLVVAAIVVDAFAYSALDKSRAARQPQKGKRASLKGIVISLLSGLLMGAFYPLVEMSKSGELGLGAYSAGLVFALGVFISTFVFNIYFMNLPVQGEPVEFVAYFRGTLGQHLLGILGGMVWCVGTLSNFVAASAPAEVNVGPAISYALGQGATMVSALWGLLVWKEFAGAGASVRLLIVLMLLLFLAGLGMVSVAPLFGR